VTNAPDHGDRGVKCEFKNNCGELMRASDSPIHYAPGRDKPRSVRSHGVGSISGNLLIVIHNDQVKDESFTQSANSFAHRTSHAPESRSNGAGQPDALYMTFAVFSAT